MLLEATALPPEINSANIYAGPGPDSMLAAAVKWRNILPEMYYASESFRQILEKLQEQWASPSATQVANAAMAFQRWLVALAQHIDRTSNLAFRLVDAYHHAHEMTVHPNAIAWNRVQLQQLMVTDLFGENAAAIAALEEQYQRFWVVDVEVIETYANEVRKALSRLTPWKPPPPITNTAGLIEQCDASEQG